MGLLFEDCLPTLVIDDHTLETGLAPWVGFETNGMLLYMQENERCEIPEGILSNEP